ncbi:MAG: Gfo/Idh/MocA family oxidoreductase [Armatimonadetes bacterium]|nr:Gfo/Idh/MocA family oxidoreductase [Armatimonadota bacterium]
MRYRSRPRRSCRGGGRWVTDYRELLADPSLDAVDLCLPHHLHRPVAVEALRAGKHVLCQKPIATTLADADAMIAAAEAAGRTLAVAEMNRFQPAIARARELLEAGLIGEPILAQSVTSYFQGGDYLTTAWRFQPEEMGGGALLDGGIHHVDVLLALLGPVVEVACLTRRVRDIFPTEDTAALLLRFASGVLGELTVMWSARHTPGQLFRVSGTAGMMVAEGSHLRVVSEQLPQHEEVFALPTFRWLHEAVADFVTAIATGRPPRMGGPEGRADLAVVLAAYEAAATRRVVTL